MRTQSSENDSNTSEDEIIQAKQGGSDLVETQSSKSDTSEDEIIQAKPDRSDLVETNSFDSDSDTKDDERPKTIGYYKCFGKEKSVFDFYGPKIGRNTYKSKKKTNIYIPEYKIVSHKVNKKAIYVKMSEGYRYMCPFCLKKFRSWGSGNAHVSKRHGGREKQCEFCDYTTWNPDALRKHIKKHILSHKGIQLYA